MINFTRVQRYYLGTLSEEDRSFILNTVAAIVKEGFNTAEGVKQLNLKNLLPPTAVEEARAIDAAEAKAYIDANQSFEDWKNDKGL